MNSLVKECIDVTRELVHPMGMGDALKVQWQTLEIVPYCTATACCDVM